VEHDLSGAVLGDDGTRLDCVTRSGEQIHMRDRVRQAVTQAVPTPAATHLQR